MLHIRQLERGEDIQSKNKSKATWVQRGIETFALYLKVSVDNKTIVHVLQTQDNFCCIETHFLLTKYSMLRKMIVEIPT